MDEWVMLSMGVTLVGAGALGFSEAARSHPRHREAVGDVVHDAPLAVAGRRLAHDGTTRAAERPEAREADVEADLGHPAVGPHEQEQRATDAPEVAGAGLVVASVAGAARHHAQALADEDAVAPGRPLTLRRDPGNEHDPNAIAVTRRAVASNSAGCRARSPSTWPRTSTRAA